MLHRWPEHYITDAWLWSWKNVWRIKWRHAGSQHFKETFLCGYLSKVWPWLAGSRHLRERKTDFLEITARFHDVTQWISVISEICSFLFLNLHHSWIVFWWPDNVSSDKQWSPCYKRYYATVPDKSVSLTALMLHCQHHEDDRMLLYMHLHFQELWIYDQHTHTCARIDTRARG